MVPSRRRQRRSVETELFEAGHRFSFFQAVALLELLRPGSVSPGAETDVHAEPVLLESSFDFGFPASDVQSVLRVPAADPDGRRPMPPRLKATMLGLGGVHGPLPNAVSELVLERARRKDHGFRAFLDIFNHRLLSLFYRLRRRARIGLGYDAPQQSPFARHLQALTGLGTPHLANRLDVPDRSLYLYAGLFAGRGRSAHGLEAMLQHYFSLPIRVRSFTGSWFELDEGQRTRIGQANHALGESVVLGRRVWDQQSGFTIEVDFRTIGRFQDFLPIGAAYQRLNALTRFYVGAEYEIFLKLRLVASDVPAQGLSARKGQLLGWTSWLGTHATDERVVWINTRIGTVNLPGRGQSHVA
jgi:type VI secretion system protein ImpH